MASLDQINGCCGIGEIQDLEDRSKDTLREVFEDGRIAYNMVVFSDRVSFGNGVKLAKYIKRNKLGVVTRSKKVPNPIHNDKIPTIALWTWIIHRKNLEKWIEKNVTDIKDDSWDYGW